MLPHSSSPFKPPAGRRRLLLEVTKMKNANRNMPNVRPKKSSILDQKPWKQTAPTLAPEPCLIPPAEMRRIVAEMIG
jgi:hypothetical protein